MSDRTERLEAELVRLEGQLASLDRDWQRLPYMAALLVLAIPCGILWGAMASALLILGVGALIGTGAYLITVRRSEYRGEIETVKRDLQVLRSRR